MRQDGARTELAYGDPLGALRALCGLEPFAGGAGVAGGAGAGGRAGGRGLETDCCLAKVAPRPSKRLCSSNNTRRCRSGPSMPMPERSVSDKVSPSTPFTRFASNAEGISLGKPRAVSHWLSLASVHERGSSRSLGAPCARGLLPGAMAVRPRR